MNNTIKVENYRLPMQWINKKPGRCLSHDQLAAEWTRARAREAELSGTQTYTTSSSLRFTPNFFFNWNIFLPLGEYLLHGIFLGIFLSSFPSCLGVQTWEILVLLVCSNFLNAMIGMLDAQHSASGIYTCLRISWYFSSLKQLYSDTLIPPFFLSFLFSCLLLVWFYLLLLVFDLAVVFRSLRWDFAFQLGENLTLLGVFFPCTSCYFCLQFLPLFFPTCLR